MAGAMGGGDLKALIGLAQAARALELSEEELVARARRCTVAIYRRQRGDSWEDAVELDDLKELRSSKPSEAVRHAEEDLARVRQELFDALGLYDEAEDRREDEQRRLRALRRELRDHRKRNSADREEAEGRQRALLERLEAQRREYAASRRELAEVETREAALERRWQEEVTELNGKLDELVKRAAATADDLRSELGAENTARALLEGEVEALRTSLEGAERALQAAREEGEETLRSVREEGERALRSAQEEGEQALRESRAEQQAALQLQREGTEAEVAHLRMERDAAVAARDEIEEVAARATKQALEAESRLEAHVEAKDREIASMEESATRWRGQCLQAEKRVAELEAALALAREDLALAREDLALAREEVALAREEVARVEDAVGSRREDTADRMHRLRDELQAVQEQARRGAAETESLRTRVQSLGEELEQSRRKVTDLEGQLENACELERAAQRYADRTEAKFRSLKAELGSVSNGRASIAAPEKRD